MSQVDSVSCVPYLIYKYIVKEPFSKTKNSKTTGLLDLVLGLVRAGVHMITNIVNQTAVARVTPSGWDLSNIVNCCKGKRYTLDRGNYRTLRSTDQILKIGQTIFEKLMRR